MSHIFFIEGLEGGPEPSWRYFVGLKKMTKTDYREYMMSRSNDNGETALNVLEPGTTAVLSHEGIVSEMESLCEKWATGNCYRGSDIGKTPV